MTDIALRVENLSNKNFDPVKIFREHAAEDPLAHHGGDPRLRGDRLSGHAEIHGRVSSLLEVGTGFHSELTGRENIYLSGTVLGMTKAEIDRKFDVIVDF